MKMLAWIAENIGTLLVAMLLLAAAAAAIAAIRKNRQGSRCACGCAHCAMAGSCHKEK